MNARVFLLVALVLLLLVAVVSSRPAREQRRFPRSLSRVSRDERLLRKLLRSLKPEERRTRVPRANRIRSLQIQDDETDQTDSDETPAPAPVDPCSMGTFRQDKEVDEQIQKVTAVTSSEEKLKKLLEYAESSTHLFTGAQVAKMMNLFVTLADKVKAFKGIDSYFNVLSAVDALNIMKGVNLDAEKECTEVVSFTKLIRDATDSSKRSCVFGSVKNKYVLFVIDISPSMYFTYQNKPRIQYVKEELINIFKNQLKDNQYFNILFFGETTRLWQSNFIQATAANREMAQKYMQTNLGEISATNINDSLEKALTLMPATEKDSAIFFLTDGVANRGKYTKSNDIVNNITTLNSKRANPVVINTVSFLLGAHNDENPQESQMTVQPLAAKNRGTFRAFEAK